ncbi:DNA sulfur modification protein DndD [Azospirillum sp. YIM DDC1]|uniref:DNA sulfur modification protein DndD n=1 Tax=Azospirillum aestuarii TaxID=2802052 RepID=A0ABS1HRT1_9PROT|nr:DNA sulfur modification protein DndD [Azospirillum aestuarii]MBK4717539.1 DNA sulfur modification protein DndD [Azospirillum aestuarii]
MLFDEITLHNFGTYLGRQTIPLTPASAERPIVLFGGLNGAGKTTLLDALQLTLFGPHARCSGRGETSYADYLSSCISRGADVPEAAVELGFRHMREGREHRFHVRRSWSRTGKGCSERLEVIVDDRMDPLLTDHWAEQVEEYMPSRLAPLFLYDGEKIEGYADPKQSARMIATAVNSLLGLDLVERLASDLTLLERRKRAESKDAGGREALAALETEVEEAVARRQAAYTEEAVLNSRLARVRDLIGRAEKRYRQEGGALYDRRAEIEAELSAARERHSVAERALRDLATGPAPLLLVRDLLEEVAERDGAEARAALDREMAAALGERDAGVLEALASWGVLGDVSARLESFLKADRERRASAAGEPMFRLGGEARGILTELLSRDLPAASVQLAANLSATAEAAARLEECRAAVEAVPSADALASLVADRDRLLAEAAEVETALRRKAAEREAIAREVERKEKELERQRRDLAEDLVAVRENSRVVAACVRVRETLEGFGKETVRRHAERIGGLVLDSLHQLLRKGTLVTDISIDPETFALALKGKDGKSLTPERLSAGERQLLSVAVLWGLARASSRPLPTVIDTPLGRLDSTHRKLLLNRYFPRASHQVILLSTDEEIFGKYYETLEPWVGRSYALEYDDARAATTVRPGYFGGAR